MAASHKQYWQASAPDTECTLYGHARYSVISRVEQSNSDGLQSFSADVLSIADDASSTSSSPPLCPNIRCQCSQAPTQSRTDAPFHPCESSPNNRPVPCRDPDQQPPSAQDVLTHSSSPSLILPNRRQRDYSQRSWRLYCVPRQLRVLHQFLWHPSSIVGFSQNETRRERGGLKVLVSMEDGMRLVRRT